MRDKSWATLVEGFGDRLSDTGSIPVASTIESYNRFNSDFIFKINISNKSG